MAGDWLKWTKGLSRKREVAIIAAALKVDRFSVAARLMEFWEWCDENVQEKDVSSMGSAVINLSQEKCDNIALIDSIVGLQGFAVAMSDAGWLAIRTSSIEVPNFVRHNGETAKTRAKNALRQQTHRKQGVTKVSQKKCDKTVTREEKRREEKKEEIYSPPEAESWKSDIVIPNGWDEAQTLEALSNWRTFRAAEDGAVPQSMSLLFLVQGKSGSGWTSAKFAESVRYTIANGWKCLADPETSRDKRRNGHKASGDAPPKPAPKVGDVTGFSTPLPSPELQRQIDLCEAAKAQALSEGKTPEKARELARQLARELAKAERKAIA